MIQPPTKALVVLSGGQDSTTCLAWAKANYVEVHAITFDYNQRHFREIEAAKNVAVIFGVASHEVVELGPVLKGRSPLTNRDENLELYSDFGTMDAIIGDRVEKTFVPMRNTLFLTIAANRASCLDCTVIITGVCQADNANYPDCRQSFIDKLELAINESLGQTITNTGYIMIKTPLMNASKAESIKLMRELGGYAALAFTHTAYDGGYPPVSQDHANTLRAQGFLDAMLPDPLVIRAIEEGLMKPPSMSENYSSIEMLPIIDDLCREIDLLKRDITSVGADA